MKRVLFLLAALMLSLTSCSAVPEYSVCGQAVYLDDCAYDFGEDLLLCESTEGDYQNEEVPENRTFEIAGKEYSAAYVKTWRNTGWSREMDVYRSAGYPLSGLEAQFYKGTDTLCFLNFGSDFQERPTIGGAVTQERVFSYVEGLLSQYTDLSLWENACSSYYTVSYQLDGASHQTEGEAAEFLLHAPLPEGAILEEETLLYAFEYHKRTGSFLTTEKMCALVDSNGMLSRLELYDVGLYDGLEPSEVSDAGLDQFAVQAVRQAFLRSENHSIQSVSVGEKELKMDMDGEPYFEVSLRIEYSGEDEHVCACEKTKTIYICRSDILEEKRSLKQAREQEILAREKRAA